MRKLTITETTAVDDLLEAAKSERVLLKRGERPIALLINVEDKDEEQIELENDPSFWQMIEERRGRPTVPLEEVKKRWLSEDSPGRTKETEQKEE